MKKKILMKTVLPMTSLDNEDLKETSESSSSSSSTISSSTAADVNNEFVGKTYEETFMNKVADLNGKRCSKPRKRLIETVQLASDENCLLSLISESEEPKSYKEVLNSSNNSKWFQAMDEEYGSLMSNETWELVPRPNNQRVIGSKWVYKVKKGPNGEINRFKARLVAQGFSQTKGIDFQEVFAPVAHTSTIRALLSFANVNKYEVHQMDIKTAFLHGVIECEIFMEQPQGYINQEKKDYVCKLKKGLYGLKQAARCWNGRLNSFLINSGYQKCTSDDCLYIKTEDKNFVLLGIYVDDIIPVSNNKEFLLQEKQKLCQEFEMTDNGEINHFLGMVIHRNKEERELFISQKTYIESILGQFGMAECKPVGTPLEPGMRFYSSDEND